MSFTVIVGNIGIVYNGTDRKVANSTFNEYKEQSKTGYGRASCEVVVLLQEGAEGKVLREYFPPCDESGDPLPPKKPKSKSKKIFVSQRQLNEIAACLALAWERAANHTKLTFEETNRVRAAMVQAQKIAKIIS